ncbi:MAG: cell division protein FtsA [Bryobacteraceae bacterium]
MTEKPTYAVGLDAGSRTTRVAICVLERGRLRFLGAGSAPSEGWEKSRIANQMAVAESVRMAVDEAQVSAGVNVESVVVGMAGQTVIADSGRGALELGHVREIEARDVDCVVRRAKRKPLDEDRMILQLYPQDFVVDGCPGHHDPHKMLASCLVINVHLATVSVQEHNALVGAVNLASVLVEESVFEPQAACYAAVRPEDRREGIALLDIGAESTGMVVYYGDSLQLACTIQRPNGTQICGDSFTRDLAHAMCLSFEDAEMVKVEYGSASPQSCSENLHVELPAPEEREPRQGSLKHVNIVMESRATELFRLVRYELAQIGMDRELMGGIFVCGGGAQLSDILDVADRELKCQARFGLPVGIRDWPEEIRTPEWTTAAGLSMYSAKIKQRNEIRRASAGWLGKVLRQSVR